MHLCLFAGIYLLPATSFTCSAKTYLHAPCPTGESFLIAQVSKCLKYITVLSEIYFYWHCCTDYLVSFKKKRKLDIWQLTENFQVSFKWIPVYELLWGMAMFLSRSFSQFWFKDLDDLELVKGSIIFSVCSGTSDILHCNNMIYMIRYIHL